MNLSLKLSISYDSKNNISDKQTCSLVIFSVPLSVAAVNSLQLEMS